MHTAPPDHRTTPTPTEPTEPTSRTRRARRAATTAGMPTDEDVTTAIDGPRRSKRHARATATTARAPRPRGRRRGGVVTGILARLGAVLALVGGLVVLPALVWAVVGGPVGIDWRGIVDRGRVDADAVVAIGLVVFTLMWVWFTITAVTEVVRVLAWRREPAATLPPLDPTPSGAIRRLVRVALVSTSTVVAASLSSLTGTSGVGAAAPAAVVIVEHDSATTATGGAAPRTDQVASDAPASVRSTGRETPYSVAARLGDPSLRDRIIELNHGAVAPDGSVWTGGVFPAGMEVAVPAGLLGGEQVVWEQYTVQEGDSVYRIATRLADGDHLRVRDLADRIIERNLGRVMGDGKAFDDPSLIRVGWVIDVPAVGTASSPTIADATSHLVQPGESYWSIAEQHADDPADTTAVAELTDELIDHNAPRLGYDLRQMLHPGDRVELTGTDVDVAVAPEPTAEDIAAEPETTDAAVTTEVETGEAETPETTSADAADAGDAHGGTTVLTVADQSSAPAGVGAGRPTGTPLPATQLPVTPLPATEEADEVTSSRAPVTTSLAAAVLVCAGALGLAESRRRQQLRRAGVHARVPSPSVRAQRVERLVRSLDATQRAVRLDLALRSAGHLLVGTGGFVLAAIVGDDAQVTLLLDRPGRIPAAPWTADPDPDKADRWSLAADVDDEQLAPTARLAGQPCPAVVHLGRVASDDGRPAEGDLFVDLEAFGLVCLDAADDADAAGADAVLRAIATSLAASPVGETLRLITHDIDTAVHLGNLNAEAADDIDTALDLAASALGSTPTAIGHKRTAELRARGTGGEAWEPVVVVSGADQLPHSALRELRDVTRGGGRGLAVVLRQPVEGASLTVRAARHGWEIERLGLTVVPVGIDLQHVHDIRHLLSSAEQPLVDHAITAPLPRAREPFTEPEWSLMVRVLGGIEVVDRDGVPVPFDRGKSLELVAWLAQHREQSTRGGARAALWESDVRDATFANIVSDARRSLAKAVTPPDGEEWIARTLTDQLPLHPLVRTDAEMLRARLEHSRGRRPAEAIEVLRPGVALIRDQPFAGTDYLWPDTEGTTSALIQLCTAASTELARHHLALGDVDGVFWATGQGLKALRGHEDLIGLRMRAHAQCGNLAGVRQEWDAYERAMMADDWSDGEPSPKLLALRKELLQH